MRKLVDSEIVWRFCVAAQFRPIHAGSRSSPIA